MGLETIQNPYVTSGVVCVKHTYVHTQTGTRMKSSSLGDICSSIFYGFY